MRLLIITQYFPPEMGAPQARLYELAARFCKRGHTVTVLTGMPNYPTGRVFDGYRYRLLMEEKIDGIRVIRTWIHASNSSRLLPRLLGYMSFTLSSLLLGIWSLGKQDVVLIESPPLVGVPAGLLIGRVTRGKIVMNVADIWPGAFLENHPMPRLFAVGMFWLERFCYEHSNVVALTNPAARKQIDGRFPHVTTTIISNGVDTDLFRPDLRSNEIRKSLGASPGDFLVGYCGLHGLSQDLRVVLAAAERLKEHSRIKFALVGDGPMKQELLAIARQKLLTHVKFLDARPKPQIPPILASCDVGLIPLNARMPGTMPSKTYEALAAGVPMIVGKGCEAEPLVSKYNTGRTYEPMDDKELAEAILDLAEHPEEVKKIKSNSRELAKRFDRNVIASQTEQVLLMLAEGKKLPEVAW